MRASEAKLFQTLSSKTALPAVDDSFISGDSVDNGSRRGSTDGEAGALDEVDELGEGEGDDGAQPKNELGVNFTGFNAHGYIT